MTPDERKALYVAWQMGATVQVKNTKGRWGDYNSYKRLEPYIPAITIYEWAHKGSHSGLQFRIKPKE